MNNQKRRKRHPRYAKTSQVFKSPISPSFTRTIHERNTSLERGLSHFPKSVMSMFTPRKMGKLQRPKWAHPPISHANRYVGQVGDPLSKAHENSHSAERLPSSQFFVHILHKTIKMIRKGQVTQNETN